MAGDRHYPPGMQRTRITADAEVTDSPGKLFGILIKPAAAESTLAVHEAANDSTAGNILAEVSAIGGTATGRSNYHPFDPPIDFQLLYAGLDGSGAIGYVYWKPQL